MDQTVMEKAKARYFAEGGEIQHLPYIGDKHCIDCDATSFLHNQTLKDIKEIHHTSKAIRAKFSFRYSDGN